MTDEFDFDFSQSFYDALVQRDGFAVQAHSAIDVERRAISILNAAQ